MLLIDSGSELNHIKISFLKDQIIVFEETVFQLKGINDLLVSTIGLTYLDVKLGEYVFVINFQIQFSYTT